MISCAAEKGAKLQVDAERVVTHRVTRGETWESLSSEFYGDGDFAGPLARYNGSSPDEPPRAGRGIRIPLSEDHLEDIHSRSEAYNLYNQGLDLVAREDFGAAVKRFQAALEKDPDFSEAAFNLGVTFQKLGLHNNAITVLRDLTRREPGNPDYFYALGNSYFHQGGLERAEENFTRALDTDSHHLKSLYSLAVVKQKLGEEGEARKLLERYLDRAPSGVWADEARKRMDTLKK